MQLVFVVFTGEAWGYLGSRRFLVELDMNSDAVRGLNQSLIETVFPLLPVVVFGFIWVFHWGVGLGVI